MVFGYYILDWLQKSRRKTSHNNDFWHFKYKVTTKKHLLSNINQKLNLGSYQFEPAVVIYRQMKEPIILWSAQDSLVLKTLSESLKAKSHTNFSKNCISNKGNGGIKKAFNVINKNIATHKYIYRTDIKKFYNSIDHQILLDKLSNFTANNEYEIIKRHLNRIEWQNGEYKEIKQGISKSSALSPVLGCIYLHELDMAMEKLDVVYQRYTDDFIIMAKTKHKLRDAVKKVKQMLSNLNLVEHPEKTDYRNFNNPKATAFNFLGVKIGRLGVEDIRETTKKNFKDKINQLYEYLQTLISIRRFVRVDTHLETKVTMQILLQIKYFGNYYKYISRFFV